MEVKRAVGGDAQHLAGLDVEHRHVEGRVIEGGGRKGQAPAVGRPRRVLPLVVDAGSEPLDRTGRQVQDEDAVPSGSIRLERDAAGQRWRLTVPGQGLGGHRRRRGHVEQR